MECCSKMDQELPWAKMSPKKVRDVLDGMAKTAKGQFWGLQKAAKSIGVLFKNECCHFCKKKKWQTYWTECNNHNNRFCDWPFRRDGMAGYEKHKKVTCSKACAQWRKNKGTLVSNKKRGQKRWSVVQKCFLDDFDENWRAKTERTYWTERNDNKRPDLELKVSSRRNGRHVNFLKRLRNGMAAPLLRVNNNNYFQRKNWIQ